MLLLCKSMLQITLTTGVILLLISAGLIPAHGQKKQRAYTADDPHGLKVVGMPKANRKYLITELPAGAETPPQYTHCGNGVYYFKEKVRGINFTAVQVYFRAEGDFQLGGEVPDIFTAGRNPKTPGIEDYVPAGWVSLTFTLLPDSSTRQEIRLIRKSELRPIPGTLLYWNSGLITGAVVRLDRSWVDKDPYVAWEILPESQFSRLIFRIRLPKSTKDCLQGK